MGNVRFGCQFYTWQMSGDKYIGALPHICGVVQQAGFAGIEPETLMLGDYYNDAFALKDILAERDLQLGALALVCAWQEPRETLDELAAAERIFRYLDAFPGTHLGLGQFPGADRANLHERRQNCLACTNAVAARAADRGLVCSFHPNSAPGSVFRVADDYKVLLDGLDPQVVGYCPDSGHIARGGMDPVAVFQEALPLIRHVHFKDYAADGQWAGMGEGIIDFPAIVTMLARSDFDGWVMVEEESPFAEQNPDAATLQNGEYLKRELAGLA